MKLSTLVEEARVVLDIPASASKDDVIALLAETALAGSSVSLQAMIDDLCKREKAMSTGIGLGIAIPHTHTPTIDRPYSAMGVSRDGVEWDAVDGEPVHIIFLLITPDSQPLLHVEALGEIATLFGNEGIRGEVVASHSGHELIDAIRRNER